MQDDIRLTMQRLTNPNNGQRRAVLDAWRSPENAYFSTDISLDTMPKGTLFVFRDDRRLWYTLDRGTWTPRLHLVAALDRVNIMEFQ